MKINLNEIFYSIQGEGPTIGGPRLFIRLSGCNLNCSFCDTQYHKEIKYTEINQEQDKLLKKYNRWCITGGEPLLQQKALQKLILKYKPEWIEIETNGTIIPNRFLIEWVNQWNISPKNKKKQNNNINIEYNIMEELVKLNSYIIKFVFKDKEDKMFIERIVNNYYIDDECIYIMPEGATRLEQKKNIKNAIKFCLKNNYNLTPRLHVLIWDNKKGV